MMVGREAIDLSPKYQRRERWTPQKQSALIESFLLNVPVPPIYLAEDEFGRYSVVDGKQRITAIYRFITGRLALTSLESFEELEGYRYDDLPRDLQNALDVRPYLRVVTLLKQSDPSLKFEVFTRLNRGGEQMEPQELRNVAFRGELNNLIFELAEHPFLRQQLKIKNERGPAYQRMADAEYVLRFLTMRSAWTRFSGSLRTAMDEFMIGHKDATPGTLDLYAVRFRRAIETCRDLWGHHAFKRPAGPGWRDQMLAGAWDAEMVAVDLLTENERAIAIQRRKDVVIGTRELFADEVFEAAVREATNTPSRVVYRIEQMHNLLTSFETP